MPENTVFCHACRTSAMFEPGSMDVPLCPGCGSDFVELSEQQLPTAVTFDARQLLENLPAGTGGGGGADSLAILQQLLTVLAGQGAQIAVQGAPGGPGGGTFNLGDFAMGGLEGVLTQLMEQHQPPNQPTARETLDSLPRRKVPASAQTKGCETYAMGENCKAGDPCSVCHTEFEAEGEVVQLPCKHCFHEACIIPWLELHHTCPICRAELPSELGQGGGAGGPAAGAAGGAGGAPGPGGVFPGMGMFPGPEEMQELTRQMLMGGTPPGDGGPPGANFNINSRSFRLGDLFTDTYLSESTEGEYNSDEDSEDDGDGASTSYDGEDGEDSEWETQSENGEGGPREGDSGSHASRRSDSPPPLMAASPNTTASTGPPSLVESPRGDEAGNAEVQLRQSGPRGGQWHTNIGWEGSGQDAIVRGSSGNLAEGEGGPPAGGPGLAGIVLAPVGWALRGAWHVGSSVLRGLQP